MLRSNSGLIVDMDSIKVEDIAKNNFNIVEDVKNAQELLNNYYDVTSEKIKADFEDDTWLFRDLLTNDKIIFDFQRINSVINFNSLVVKEILIKVVKCWIVAQLSEKSLKVSRKKYLHILSAIFITNGFELSYSNRLIELTQQNCSHSVDERKMYERIEMTDNQLFDYIVSIVDFLKFYAPDKYISLIGALEEIKGKTLFKSNYRTLPSFKDILKFKMYLEDWFEYSMKKEDDSELIRFYPLVLWWKLTSIIPMRPTEFCQIKKDALEVSGDNYFITFPRFKEHRKGESRIKITYDTLPIPKELYESFQHYVVLTERFEETDYLINIHAVANDSVINSSIFNLRYLTNMIGKFYKEIIFKRYRVNILSIKGSYKALWKFNDDSLITSQAKDSIQSMILAGDLRHIAIINMMMQGYDKVEIQRLSGHFLEETQYTYFNHMENWMDGEIQKIEREFRNLNPSMYLDDEKVTTVHPSVSDFFDKRHKLAYIQGENDISKYQTYIQLNIGYCKDETMPCPTFNWRHSGCYFCENWTISSQELMKKRDIIINDLNIIYEELRGKINFIQYLFSTNLDDSGLVDANVKKDLISTTNEIHLGMKQVVKLKVLLGVVDYE
ncbi:MULTISPECIES: hypothetical protein [Bacillus cereus group]|uniref:Integrase n=1 Tax=Bacillus thuringiensis TaxID=1428 RepID=A0AAW9JF36_BACTU|nr:MULTISPECIES: hypothetical protein [Bacillus cereus group]MDZ5480007.1 hypothetical protein [Bacillus thuringiensis]MRB34648.1 hypothetical protein [Bacillus thuringiensis]PGU55014.1 hypothetical protein COD72_12700 [Bacillus cereus]